MKLKMETFIIFIILPLLFVIYCITPFIRHRRRTRFYLNKIPGPPGFPIIGNILDFIGTPEQLWNTLRLMGDKYYPIYKVWGVFDDMVNIRHPDDAEVLLASSKNITKSGIYNFLRNWFGTGLLTSTDRKWQHRRKIITPAFHFNVLQEFADVFDQEGHRMVQDLNLENGPVTMDLVSLTTKYTLNAICETAMGTSLSKIESSGGNIQKLYRKSVHDLGDLVIYRLLRPWLHPNRIYSMTAAGRLHKECLKVVRGFSKQIIGERQKYHEDTNGMHLERFNKSNKDTEIMYTRSSNKQLAMLDLLIAAKKNDQIDDSGIWEEVNTFIFEGHDTTAMGICFTLLLLAEHSDIQQRVRDEIDEVLKKCDNHMGIAELQQLPYLDRCIKEALRLYPSVPFISRQITHDMQLKNYMIPAGTIASVHIYDLHRDPNFWPDPLRYDPDRFLPERIQGRHPFSYIPFSGGPRNCIGQKFGMMEMKAMVGHLIHNFYLEPIDLANEISISTDLVLRPKHTAKLKFVPR